MVMEFSVDNLLELVGLAFTKNVALWVMLLVAINVTLIVVSTIASHISNVKQKCLEDELERKQRQFQHELDRLKSDIDSKQEEKRKGENERQSIIKQTRMNFLDALQEVHYGICECMIEISAQSHSTSDAGMTRIKSRLLNLRNRLLSSCDIYRRSQNNLQIYEGDYCQLIVAWDSGVNPAVIQLIGEDVALNKVNPNVNPKTSSPADSEIVSERHLLGKTKLAHAIQFVEGVVVWIMPWIVLAVILCAAIPHPISLVCLLLGLLSLLHLWLILNDVQRKQLLSLLENIRPKTANSIVDENTQKAIRKDMTLPKTEGFQNALAFPAEDSMAHSLEKLKETLAIFENVLLESLNRIQEKTTDCSECDKAHLDVSLTEKRG